MIRGLTVNSKKIKKTGKMKLIRTTAGMLSLVTALSIVLTGCSNGYDNGNKGDYYYTPPSSIVSYENYDVMNDPFVKTDDTNYSNSELFVTDNSYNAFINYIDNMDTKYNYEKYYRVDEAYSRYQEAINRHATTHSYSLENITVDALVESVKKNNKEFLLQKKAEYTMEFYEEFSDSDLRKYCSIIIEIVQNYENKGLIENIEEVKCILGDLKIFSRPTMTNAYVTDDNCLMISPSMIKTLKIKTINKSQDVEKSTIAHEAIHLLQKGCRDNEDVYVIGNSYKFDDLDVNPLFYNWFYEGSAEKLMMNTYNYSPLVYESFINYINSFGLSTVLSDKNYVNQPEETSLSNSLEPLFNMFGCKTDNDKKEIIKMMFSLDIIQTETEDFIKAMNPDMNDTELVNIKRDLKGSICETLTKYFYKNLATLVKEKNIPLNDVFYLITVFESDVDSHITYSDTEKYNASIGFIENYIEIQNNFFDYVASNGKYTQEEIEQMFDNYGLKNSDNKPNYDLSYLSKEKQEFMNNMMNTLYGKSKEQIIDVYRRNSGSVKK